jgi:ferredoxin
MAQSGGQFDMIGAAGYWMKMVKCQDACPVHTDACGYVNAIAEGRDQDAYRIARAANPFASICGRVCGAPYEANCRRGDLDSPVSIRALKRFVTSQFGPETGDFHYYHEGCNQQMLLPGRGNYKSIAVVAAGVPGLTVAHDLAQVGYKVTVFEAYSAPGGMLTAGVPAFRLPRVLVMAEINAILSLGIELKCNQRLGRNFTIQSLREQGFKAIFLGVGLPKGRKLDLPGADLTGVYDGIDFLHAFNEGRPLPVGKRVIVIGGGNVAYDVARSAVRMSGDKEVHVVCLEKRSEIPADLLHRLLSLDMRTADGVFGASVTLLTFLDFAFLLQRFCTAICPCGYLQNMLADRHTLQVFFQNDAGRCIHCEKCVRACPKGIDIRNGSHQLECTHCAECIDACSEVLGRLGRQSLIHYAWGDPSQNVAADRPWYRRLGFRDGKRIAVLVLLFIYASGLSLAIHMRQPELVRIMPDRITLYTRGTDGLIHNRFRLQASNRGRAEARVTLSLADLPAAHILGMRDGVALKPGETQQFEFDVEAPGSAVSPGVNHLRILAHIAPTQEDGAFAETFIAPMESASPVEPADKQEQEEH